MRTYSTEAEARARAEEIRQTMTRPDDWEPKVRTPDYSDCFVSCTMLRTPTHPGVQVYAYDDASGNPSCHAAALLPNGHTPFMHAVADTHQDAAVEAVRLLRQVSLDAINDLNAVVTYTQHCEDRLRS